MIVDALSRRSALAPKTDTDWRRVLGLRSGGLPTHAGPQVNEWTSLAHATVYACVKVLAESVGQLPMVLFERGGSDSRARERAEQHPLYRLVHDEPNPEMTSQEVRECMMAFLATHGNALAALEFDRFGRILEIWPIPWSQVEMKRGRDGGLRYIWTPLEAPPTVLRADQAWHVRGLGWTGLQGLSPIAIQREAIGHGLAMAEYQSRFFSNNAEPGGVLHTDANLTDSRLGGDVPARIREDWERMHQGLDRAHKVAILDNGLKWQSVSIPAKDAQFLESRKLNRTEIAGWFRVPAHMVNDLEKATFSNIEHLGIEFVVHTLAPWLVRFEQSGNRQLLLDQEKGRFFLKHVVDALLRGDTAARYQAYQSGIQSGWLMRNEAREKEDLNPLDGLDEPLVPGNMMEEGEFPGDPPPPARSRRGTLPPARRRSAAARRRLARSFGGLFEDAAGRALRAEEREVRKLVERHLADRLDLRAFEDELVALYGEDADLVAVIRDAMRPASDALVRASWAEASEEVGADEPDEGRVGEFVAAVAAAYATGHAAESRRRLGRAARDGELETAGSRVGALFDRWKEERPAQVARKQTVKQSRAAAKAAYQGAGVKRLRWVAVGEDCPMCARLDGRVVGIEGPFVREGETFEAEGAAPLRASTSVNHPPLHDGCDCDIVPELD